MANLSLIKGFITHRLSANTRHGVHSPFVYQLVDKVIYDTRSKPEYVPVELLRKELLKDERVLNITDLGAGSHVNNNTRKPVKALARHALKPSSLAQLVFRLARSVNPRHIIELGTCLGLTTAYLAKACPGAKVTSIEGCADIADVARENLDLLNIANADILVGNFDDLLPGILESLEQVDFMFVDGNHRKEATLDYFSRCLPKVHENSLLIFDDIYWSPGMKEAWEQIKAHPAVTITVDLFWIGLVFFRKGQAKEHFKIKY